MGREVRSTTSGMDSIDGQEVRSSRTLSSDSPIALAKSSELVHSSRPATAILTSSFVGSFGALRERLACTSFHTPSHGGSVANVGANHRLNKDRNCWCEFPYNSTS
jgi:hypothetical protein